ncbi:MAG TPA: alpha/beta hydrolase [Candidatus Paceibacterota bacterium]|nr:alpha/beta hydrolase [Candidatus Paceibacterota bacterium]
MGEKVYIIHNWDGTPGTNWYPWLKQELEAKGFLVVVPEMPDTAEPVIEKWVEHLKNIISVPDDKTYFIGHSIGCQTAMRYLESSNDVKIGGALFVAGWFKLDNLEDKEVARIAEPWLTTPINFEKVKNSITKLHVLLSSDDPYDCTEENKSVFIEKLSAEVLVENDKGHFTREKYEGILEEFLKIAS